MSIIEPSPVSEPAQVEEELARAFAQAVRDLQNGCSVVVVLDDAALLGHRGASPAAVAGGLLGLVRALAIEGEREGWRINALVVDESVTEADRAAWLSRLEEPSGALGSVLRIGQLQRGRLPL